MILFAWCMAYAFGGSLWVLNISVTCTQHFTASSHVNASWLSVLLNPGKGESS